MCDEVIKSCVYPQNGNMWNLKRKHDEVFYE
jgi:hypothetical protein